MANTSICTLRLPQELEAMIDICPGDTRTARVIGIIKFAFEQGYPGTEITDHSQTELLDRIKELEERTDYLIRFIQRVKDLEEKGKQWHYALEKHHDQIETINMKLSRRLSVGA